MADKPDFVFEVDPYELAVRLAEVAIDMKRPQGLTSAEAWGQIISTAPDLAPKFFEQARVAAEYMTECVKKPGRVN